MIRLCICGGRDYFNSKRIYETLDYFHKQNPFILISGAATGADTIGLKWAFERGVVSEAYPADWKKHGRAAGPIRNQKMLDSKINVLVAFPGGVGTNNMIDICVKANVPVVKVDDVTRSIIKENEEVTTSI